MKFKSEIKTILFLWLLIIAVCGVVNRFELAEDQINILQAQITAMQTDAKALQQRAQPNYTADIQKLKDDVYDLDQRLIPVEKDQAFYKDVWRDYFKMGVGK